MHGRPALLRREARRSGCEEGEVWGENLGGVEGARENCDHTGKKIMIK